MQRGDESGERSQGTETSGWLRSGNSVRKVLEVPRALTIQPPRADVDLVSQLPFLTGNSNNQIPLSGREDVSRSRTRESFPCDVQLRRICCKQINKALLLWPSS